MGKPEDIPQDVWDQAQAVESECINATWNGPARGSRTVSETIIARAILAAKAEERARWHPAVVYFERYCQDEADDVETCVCGLQQHTDAQAFAAVVAEVNTAHKSKTEA